MYNRNYTRTESFQDLIARLYPATELSPEVRERVLFDKDGKEKRYLARTCTFQVTDACNLACSYCLLPGTKITMANHSLKNIEDIKIGDKILGFDESDLSNLHTFEATVDQVMARKTDTIINIKFDGDNRELNITPDHKVIRYVDTGKAEWTEAKNLRVGDTLRLQSLDRTANKMDALAIITSITETRSVDKATGKGTYTVYNIGTSCRTYIANFAAVHNCYQINKKTHIMDFETAKKFADMILDANMENNPYIDVETSPGIVFEFIGGEPFMAIDLIQQISDYIVDKMIKTNHPWMNKFMFSICSNGVLYMNEKVQAYMNKYKYNLSFSISIDGNKELHDKCRVFPDGRGSYDIAIAGVEHFRKHYNGKMGSKMTMAPSNISYVFDAVKNLIELKYDEIFLNCVYEKGWEPEHATILYEQFKRLSDFLIDEGYFENTYLSYFDDTQFKPMSESENENWCGGTGSMISCDYKGDIYPCIRYMESSIGDSVKPLIIGNVYEGIMHDAETKDCVSCLRAINRRSQSTDECYYCPIAGACSWCSAYNYQENGTADKRCTYICIMHKGRTLANIYYWNKGFRKYAPWFRFESWIPKEWALDIISEEEYDMLMSLIDFGEDDMKKIQEMLDNDQVDSDYINMAKTVLETGHPIFTNDISDVYTRSFGEDGKPKYDNSRTFNKTDDIENTEPINVTDIAYKGVFDYIEDQGFDIHALKTIEKNLEELME